jgi:preprotein translocase subunit SecA
MALEGLTAAVGAVLRKVFGSRNDRLVRAYARIADESILWDEKFANFQDEDFPKKTEEFRQRLKAGETLGDILPEAFALVRLAAEQAIGLRPYKVQLIGGQVLADGKIAEMVTGEGKTLVSVLPNYLQALAGHAHLVTVNDYLVRRDALWMGPIYQKLGLTVGFIQTPMDPAERIPQYSCDLTYGTNNEFGFDYLRDNMKMSREEQVQGDLNFVIVDEVDSVLIDEARTPLIISGPAFESTQDYARADEVVRKLKAGTDFEIKEKEHTCALNDRGVKKAEGLVGVGSFYIAGNMHWPHKIEQALRAHFLYRRDKEYVVQGDEVIIVDEFTGRLMPGRQWSDGLHQAVEAKEGIRIKEETQTLATITFQNFFRLYRRLAGMTGTAMTEAEEFNKIYKLETVAIPTNRPLDRVSHPDVVFMTVREKFKAIVDEIHEFSERGRPVLVGTISIENSEKLSNALSRSYGIEHEVLSAKHHQREAEIVAQAGQRHVDRAGKECGNVTIATNMAGRGTDIKLGAGVVYANCHGPWDVQRQSRPDDFGNKCCIFCPEYDGVCAHCFKPQKDPAFPKRGRTECREDPPCGLHIVGTERHESRRIDNQLRGRSGRQGDPGSSRFFLSLEDDLMRVFAKDWVTSVLKRLGMEEGMALEHNFLSRGIENAQKKVEEHNFHIRKNLLDYDEVMDKQRKVFYGRRQDILNAGSLRPTVWEILTENVQEMLDNLMGPDYRYDCVAEWARRTFEVTVKTSALRGRTVEDLDIYLKDRAIDDARSRVSETIGEFYESSGDDDEEMESEEPSEVESEDEPPEVDYRGLTAWARDRLGVAVNERDLRNMSNEDIDTMLQEAAAKKVQETDCSAIKQYLDEDYPLQVLTAWLKTKFELQVAVEELRNRPAAEIEQRIMGYLTHLYDQKEREYPITYAIDRALNAHQVAGTFDFAGLARWASWYYAVPVTEEEVHLTNFEETRQHLLQVAERAEKEQALAAAIARGLARYLSSDEASATDHNLPAIRTWAAETLGVELRPDELRDLPRGKLAEMLLGRARAVRRMDMNNLERYLLLQVYDTSWKDHLYIMDHLKSGVGLRGYAQVDPKIEYKREGLKQFEQMLAGINEKFADLFFKARWVQREALNRIWSGQSAEHEELAPGMALFDEQKQAAMEALKQQTAEKPKPIVRTAARVGRNDPCPCGSGKKFKKCCGTNV